MPAITIKSLTATFLFLQLFAALAVLAGLSACTSSPPEPVGALVYPTHRGVEVSKSTVAFQTTYVWRIRDNDGIEHTATWRSPSQNAERVAHGLDTCIDECKTKLRYPETSEVACPVGLEGQRSRDFLLFPVFVSCANSVELADYVEKKEPYATEYRVQIYAGDAARFMASGEQPLSRYLGAARLLRSTVPAEKPVVVSDVDGCLRNAAVEGTIQECGSSPLRCKTIKPMLRRFDDCLRSRSYEVTEQVSP